MAITTDSTATEPAFVVERFAAAGDRLEVAGHWRGVRGRRFVRPVLWLHQGELRRRLVAVLDHKPWAADDGTPWVAAFKWEGGKLDAERAELEVGRDLVVDLPVPGAPASAPEPRPARPRAPSELERVREQLLSATKERRELEAALGAATARAEELARVREERDRAREEARRAREDGERLVNDEYRQRERALQVAEQAAARAREAEAAQRLAERQLGAARAAHAELETRLSAVTDELERTRDELAGATAADESGRLRDELASATGESDRLRAELAAASGESERLRAELATSAGDRDAVAAALEERDRLRTELSAAKAAPQDGTERLERELAAAWGERDKLATELTAARAGRERVEAELKEARSDRKRLERELTVLREREALPRRRRRRLERAEESRLAPPSGNALWVVRLVALGLVAILLAAIAFLLTSVL